MQLITCSLLAVTFLVCFAPSFISAQSGACTVCQLLVATIDGYLKQNHTQEQIIRELDLICSTLSPPFNTGCSSFVHQWVPKLIEYLLKYAELPNACTKLGVCQGQELETPLDVQFRRHLQEALRQNSVVAGSA